MRSAIAALLLAVSACAHYPVNPAGPPSAGSPRYEFDTRETEENSNGLFVCLAFSGGGTRAAALSYGVLERLRDTKIVWKGKAKRLLDEVDCISSVSGGSFTAAYYALFGERIFAEFPDEFLYADVQGALAWRAANPLNWPRLWSPHFGRIDLAAEYYDEKLFAGSTFAALSQARRRPFVMLNATNMAMGSRFEFTQPEFDLLASDLNGVPVARAVAASSAFPFLLSPIALDNHPHAPDYVLPTDVSKGLESFYSNRRRYQWAKNRARYQDAAELPHVYLMDGGLSDNIGLRAIDSAYARSSGFLRKLINDEQIEKLLVIVVNARSEAKDEISKRDTPPGLIDAAYGTATISLDNYSFETIELFKDELGERKRAQDAIAACQRLLSRCPSAPKLPQLSQLEMYVVQVDFEAIQDEKRRRHFFELPTSFALERGDVTDLIAVGKELLDADPAFKAFLGSLSTSPGR